MQKFTKSVAVALVATVALLGGSAFTASADASPVKHMKTSDTGWGP